MIYYLFEIFREYDIPGSGLFRYISFRSAITLITSLFIALFYGKKIINLLQKKQIGEDIRKLGLAGQDKKQGTPTMGGIIIILSTIIPVLLFAKINNIYVILLLISMIWMGAIGFLDDYIKVFKKNKSGLKGKFKIIGQVGLGVIVGVTMYFSPSIVIKERINNNNVNIDKKSKTHFYKSEVKTLKTTIPFLKNNEFDYSSLLPKSLKNYVWILFVIIVTFIITAVSNGANLTDGIDGLSSGISAIQIFILGIFAWVSGNIIFSDYLNIIYIPNAGEIVIFISSLLGALIGFLWYNTYPAQIFMGDTGSLTLGGIISVIAVLLRKELLIPILSGIFLIESVSVILQVAYFKYTKKRYGEGKRIFKMAPLHHHYQKLNYHESKITSRFWIIGIILGIATFITLKLR